jgi:hypothetical protein
VIDAVFFASLSEKRTRRHASSNGSTPGPAKPRRYSDYCVAGWIYISFRVG